MIVLPLRIRREPQTVTYTGSAARMPRPMFRTLGWDEAVIEKAARENGATRTPLDLSATNRGDVTDMTVLRISGVPGQERPREYDLGKLVSAGLTRLLKNSGSV